MSAPGGQPSSAKAIRVVPYSPPRPANAASHEESHAASELGSARQEHLSTDDAGQRNPNSGLSNSSSSGGEFGRAPPFAREKRADVGVSGRGEPATFRGSSTTTDHIDLSTGLSPSAIPAHTAPPSRGRLSTATSYTTSSTRQSTSSRSSHISDSESEAPSTVGTSRRPQSRRRNFVAVLNDDKKTFSLVPQRPRAPDTQSLSSQDPPRSESALSEYGGGPSFRSSQLHSFPTTPRVSQASSHEGVSSYASSHEDRPNSSLAGNFPDRSITPATPTSVVPSSPALTITDDLVPDSSPIQWNRRMGVRRVNADLEEKHSFHTQTSKSDTTETPPAAAATDTNPTVHGENPVETQSTPEAPLSFHSPSHSSGSDRTNYRVYGDDSEAPIDHNPDPTNQGEEDRGSDDSPVDPHLRPQPSFVTAHTASTDFENSNYKIYGHSDSEGSEEDHQDSPVTGPSSRALRIPHIPFLEPQSSFASLQSTASSTSDNPNYRVYGPTSPVLPPVPETEPLQGTHELRPAQSFLSAVSSLPDNDNYIVYGRSSPAALSSVESFNPPSESGSYAPLISSTAVHQEAGPSTITNSTPNYIVHGDPTPDPSREATPDPAEPEESAVRQEPHQNQETSPDTSVVSPSKPRRSQDGFGYFRARSRSISKEEVRAKKSLKSVKSSISSIINEDAAEGFFAGQAYLDAPPGEYEVSSPSVAGPSDRQRQLDEQRERERQQREASAWEGEGAAPGSPGSMALPTTPHQWSSQLSTVISETEPEESNGTRSSLASVSLPGGSVHGSHGSHASQGSQGSQGSHERRNSRGWSTHSRQMLSISSSLAADLESASRSRSNSQPGSVDRPSPSYRYQGQVRHHDEDGDGLADLHLISPRPSRSRLSDMFSHSNASDRNLHSSASTRSFNNGIPTWAKLYYGSGERRFLRSASISSASDLSSSRPESMLHHSHSPSSDQFPSGLWSARRRPTESGPADSAQRRSATGSMGVPGGSADDHVHDIGFRRSLRRMTSSVWSPHLQRDVRAQNRYTIWDSPSVAWSAESGMFGRRNLQVVLFVVGFIFPFAWMIGALLPLPKPSPLAMVQRDSSYSDLGVRSHSNEFERHIESVDELRFRNARWWRMLNRCMSVIGLLIIGAIIGLAVAAVKQGWATRNQG